MQYCEGPVTAQADGWMGLTKVSILMLSVMTLLLINSRLAASDIENKIYEMNKPATSDDSRLMVLGPPVASGVRLMTDLQKKSDALSQKEDIHIGCRNFRQPLHETIGT